MLPLSSARSRFVWYELMTTDVPAAIAFYRDVVGWQTQAFASAAEAPPYQMWRTPGGDTVGGVFALPQEARDMGAPPRWMGNVCVEDTDAAVARVDALGGRVHKAPFDVPNVGRVAIVADPTGAGLALFQPFGDAPGHEGRERVGEFSWRELHSTDPDQAWAFYEGLLGWRKTDAMDMGEGRGRYQMFAPERGDTLGGMTTAPSPSSAWLFYVFVEDLDRSIATATERGGRLVSGPTPIPGGDRVAVLVDPQGATFALHGR